MNRSKLNFSQLEGEYELLSPSEASSIKGGVENVGNLGTVTIVGQYNNGTTYDWASFLGQFTINSQGQAIFTDNWSGATGGGSINLSDTFKNINTLSDEALILSDSIEALQAVKAFSALSNIAVGVGFAFDAGALYAHYNSGIGNMDGIRFSIKTGTTGAALVAGAAAGTGGTAVVVGLLVGGAGLGAEYAYDTAVESLNRIWGNFVTNHGNGGMPVVQ